MDDAPSGTSTSPPTAATMVSLWQANSVGFKVERRFAMKKLEATAVGKLSGVNWVSVGSPALA
jgi:hypothetical protein